MTEVFFDDSALDLDPSQTVAITRQINDIGDLENRQVDFTNRFKALRTHRNDKTLESLVKVYSGSLLAYRNSNGLIRSDGVDIARGALAQISEVTEKAYTLVFFNGVLNFFDALAGKKLSDLDLSAFDHTWSASNAVNSQLTTTGYIYAVCEFGGLSNPGFGIRDIDVRGLVFSMFVNSIVDQIFTDAGFTKSGDIFSDNQYLDLILPMSNDAFSIQTGEDFSASKTANQGPTAATTSHILITFPIQNLDEGNNYDGTDEYTVPRNMSGKLRAQINITVTGLTSDTLFINLRNNTTILAKETLTANVTTTDFELSFDENYVATAILDLTFNKSGITDTVLITIHSGEFELQATPTKPRVSSIGTIGFVYVSENLPDMTQLDFLGAIMKMFALIPVYSPEAPLDVEFKGFQKVFDNAGVAIDWSKKLDLTKEIKQEFTPGSYGKTSVLRFKEDSINDNPNFGIGTFTIDDETLEEDKDVVTIPFSPSLEVVRLADFPEVVAMAKVQRFTRTGSGFGAYVLDQKISPRILRVVTVNKGSGGTFDFHQGAGVNSENDISAGRFVDTGDADSIEGQNLLDEHYKGFVAAAKRFKKISAFFFLTAADIQNLDHFIPVYVEFLGSKFYINKVKNYISGQSTKVELFRL